MSTYQAFAFLWNLDNGDIVAANLVAIMPHDWFVDFDRMIDTAFAFGFGFAMNAKN